MGKRVLTIGLCAAAGAAASFLMAWAIVALQAQPGTTSAGPFAMVQGPTRWPVLGVGEGYIPPWRAVASLPGLTREQFTGQSVPPGSLDVYIAGWPARSLIWEDPAVSAAGAQTRSAWRNGIVPPWRRPAIATTDGWRRLPVRPVWEGTLVNTAFYGAAAWLVVWGAARVRARRRAAQGLCVACGYPVRGLGAGARCPECGEVAGEGAASS